jgi:hypothetical protein
MSAIFEQEHVDIVFGGHVHNHQRSLPLSFQIEESARPGNTTWKDLVEKPIDGGSSLDQTFDGVANTRPKGIIHRYRRQLAVPVRPQDKEISRRSGRSSPPSSFFPFTLVDIRGGELSLKQVSEDGGSPRSNSGYEMSIIF